MINIGLEYEQLESVHTDMALYGTYFLLPCDSASFSSTDLEYIWILFSFSFVHYEKKFLYLILFLFVNYLSCIHIWVLTSNETRVKILPADIVT